MKINKMKKMEILIIVMVSLLLTSCSFKKDDTKDLIDKGMKAIEMQNYEEAVKQFQVLIKSNKELQMAYRGEGMAYLSALEYEKAIKSFDNALKESSGKIRKTELDISYYKAEAQYKAGDSEGAIKTYSNLIDFNPKPDSYYLRGKAYIASGQLDKAKDDFDKAISKDKKNYNTYLNVYDACAEYGYADEGKVYLKKALEIKGDKDINKYNRGKAYYYLENFDKAKTQFTSLKSGDYMDSQLYLGKVYEGLGKMELAYKQYEMYLKKNPKSAEAYNQVGLGKMAAKDYPEALKTFQNGIKNAAGNEKKELLYNEAIVYEYLGDFIAARDKMQQFVALYPNDTRSAREYEFLITR